MRAKEFITEEHQEKMLSFDKMDNYQYYRFGMNMGGGEGLERAEEDFSNYIAYTAEDEEKIKSAAKQSGKTVRKRKELNKELDGTNNTSPVAKKKKNKYGV